MTQPALQSFGLTDLLQAADDSSGRYLEFLRVPALSAGIYSLSAGSEDLQQPHEQDEIYYVLSGRSKFVCNEDVIDVEPGALLYVAKQAVHRFFDIEEDLRLIVVFAPEEQSA